MFKHTRKLCSRRFYSNQSKTHYSSKYSIKLPKTHEMPPPISHYSLHLIPKEIPYLPISLISHFSRKFSSFYLYFLMPSAKFLTAQDQYPSVLSKSSSNSIDSSAQEMGSWHQLLTPGSQPSHLTPLKPHKPSIKVSYHLLCMYHSFSKLSPLPLLAIPTTST